MTSLGKLYTWGSGHSYQLGNEEMEDEAEPYRVPLKTRKCFWARCGGQFTMFLLGMRYLYLFFVVYLFLYVCLLCEYDYWIEPKEAEADATMAGAAAAEYRQPQPLIAPSSLPGSPQYAAAMMQQQQQQSSSNGPTPNKAGTQMRIQTTAGQTSPTRALQASFETVCVSPDKKRPRVLSGGSDTSSLDVRMAPWSPTKLRVRGGDVFGAGTQASGSGAAADGSGASSKPATTRQRSSVQQRFKRAGL